jgi:ABC-2 type transport system ATP-binding protein
LLRVEDLSKSFGSIQAVKGVTASFRTGALTILAGADGAGKSTLLKMMLGLVKADKGKIYLNEKHINMKKHFSGITSITGYMPERFSLYFDLSVEENMDFFADIQSVPKKRREELKKKLLEKTGMWAFKKRKAGALSGGMKQKLSLSTILLSSPEIIILDEPTTGVDPLSRIEFFRIIDELKEEGKTIIASTPYLDEAEKGDDLIFFKNGRVIRSGNILQLKKEFPAQILSMRSRGAIFDELEALNLIPSLNGRVYAKGKNIRIMLDAETTIPSILSAKNPLQVPATLEDIFLYYERSESES